VKVLLYSKNIISKNFEFRRQNEKVAIRVFENQYKKSVRPCGLFINAENSFLSASPDGYELYVQHINRDKYIWTNKMLLKLTSFYVYCI
jgi:hypothetical protein